MKRPCEDSSSAESNVDVDGDRSVYPGLMKVTMIRCDSSPTTTTQVMARKKRRGIIEKRRRDRINNSLSELRRLVPSTFEKQGSAKLEKAEILQMTVDHLKMLQLTAGRGYFDAHALALDFLSLGFRECLTEVSRYLSAAEGVDSGGDPLRSRLLSHLASCASQRDAAATALTVAAHSPHHHHHHHHHHQPPPTFPPPLHPHHWAAASAAGLRGGGAPQRPTELSQPSVTSSYPSLPDSTSSSSSSSSPTSSSSSLVLPCGPAPLSTSLLSLSTTSFPVTLHGGFPLLPPSSSSSSQTHNPKPYRPWGTEVGAF